MKKLIILLCCTILWVAPVSAAKKIDQASLASWAKSAKVPGYSFGGVDESDPGVYMAMWQNSKEEMIGLQVHPGSEFKKLNAVINKERPTPFSYNGVPALYTDALAPSASMALHYEAAGKTVVMVNMGQPRVLSKDEMIRIFDGMKIDQLFK